MDLIEGRLEQQFWRDWMGLSREELSVWFGLEVCWFVVVEMGGMCLMRCECSVIGVCVVLCVGEDW